MPQQDRPWLPNYPSGIPANINPDSYPTLISMLEETFKTYKNRPAFSNMGKTLTFGEVDKLSKQFGAYLNSRGLKVGDKIALMMPNLLQYPIALFGALRAGVIVVNTNPLYTPREMRHQFTDAGVKGVIISENYAANLQKVLGDTQIDVVIVTSLGEMLGWAKKKLTNFVVRSIKGMVPKYDIPNTVNFTEALQQGKKFSLPTFQGNPNDTILLQYTGGTTGVAKGAMLTNRNMVANMEQFSAWMQPFLKDKETALCPLPLYHIFAFMVNCLSIFKSGGHNVLITNPRDLSTVVKAYKDYPISIMVGVNTLYNALLNDKGFQQLDFTNLHIAAGGGMAVQRAVAEGWQKLTGCALSEGFGMTELSPVASSNPIDGTGRIGTIGLPIPSTDMRITDEAGHPLPVGEVGEIQVKGPQVMKGYYNRPDATAETITEDGWLKTGDIGKMSEDGFFQIVDRKKDMILVSGFNVYPNEIEDVIAGHAKVLEVAAVGQPHEKSGEVVKIFVVKKDKSLSEKELIEFCRENMTGYKVPKTVVFRDELPKSNVGKILRRKLRDEEKAV
ncbi:MAG: AMP-binding protein [Saprospiraceae bacterium]